MLLFSNNNKYSHLLKEVINIRSSSRETFYLNLFKFSVGDVLIVFFWIKGILYRFEGICICIRKKNIKQVNVSLILRNVLSSIGVELCISYYYNRLFFLKFSDYKRKKYIYIKAKLYYLRNKLNKASRII